jgi:hypothetical protein
MSKARNLANLLADGAVGADELASTLDLSSKTLTLPAGTALPSQSGQNGNFLTTDGTSASWGAVDAGGGGVTTTATEIVVNDSGANLDFRVEGDTDPNAIFLDASTNNIGIGTTDPNGKMMVNGRLSVGSSKANSQVIANFGGVTTIYVGPSGNDTTGDGTSGNPYATAVRASRDIPKNLNNSTYQIWFLAGTYTVTGNSEITGFIGSTYYGGRLILRGETTASTVLNLSGGGFDFYHCKCKLEISNITINTTSGGGFNMRFFYCDNVWVLNTVTYNKSGSHGWMWAIQWEKTHGHFQGTIAYDSGATGGLGGALVLDSASMEFYGTITKSGSRIGNNAISVNNDSYLSFGGTINNFNDGINFYQHYGNSGGGVIYYGGGSITNCTVGVRYSHGCIVGSYSTPSFSGNATNIAYQSVLNAQSDWSQMNKLLVGYTTSNGGYNLQVNSQIFATSSTIATSDGRYKTDVVPITNALEVVTNLNPVQFKWIPHDVHEFDTENVQVGFIAQEVMEALAHKPYLNSIIKTNQYETTSADIENVVLEEAIPPTYNENGVVTDPGKPAVIERRITKPAEVEEFYGIAESNLVAILTKAIQELSAKNDALEARVAALESGT